MDFITRGPSEEVHSCWDKGRDEEGRDEASLGGWEGALSDGLGDGVVDEEEIKGHYEESRYDCG